jgi:hypothetical protein
MKAKVPRMSKLRIKNIYSLLLRQKGFLRATRATIPYLLLALTVQNGIICGKVREQ